MRRLVLMLAGLALLAPASEVASARGTAAPSSTELGDMPIGCVGAAASFTGQAYCLDGNHAEAFGIPKGALTDETITFGALQLNGWQVATRCNGNGTSGKREQLVYVHVQGEPDISATAIPFLQQRLIPGANGVFEHTTGGKRAVRWVTKKTATGCIPTVLKVTVPKSANVSGFPFSNIGNAVLRAVGGPKANRSYLVMVDHPDVYYDCGLGQVRQDARPGPANRNDSGGAFAMVWSNCWTGLIAAHELTHTMGAVQPGAPHHTSLGHCWDGRDAMCYADGSPQQQKLVCKKADDFRRLDCNGDDYFALYPKPGSYLASHWNSASSQFLINSKPTVLPTQPGKPTGVTVTTVDAHHVRVAWKAGLTKHGASTSWTVLVGATYGGTQFGEGSSFPITDSLRQVKVSGKVRSALVTVKPNVSQGFAVYATNASGDGLTSAIVNGGAGSAPSAITATFTPDDYSGQGNGQLTWTGGTSAAGVTTCVAVLVNGVRVGYPGTVESTTDPSGFCASDSTPHQVWSLVSTDVLQILSRNAFGTTIVTVAHP
ncbi:MAG: hypothetical protein QOJ11_1259 [Frankiales bacterium]|jgi:hypothetical protein|nr:hypothetical protein [Frankiales bacterium]